MAKNVTLKDSSSVELDPKTVVGQIYNTAGSSAVLSEDATNKILSTANSYTINGDSITGSTITGDKLSSTTLVTSVSSTSTDKQVPSAKAMYTALSGKQATLTAGSNISITTDSSTGKTTIASSYTDTTYTAGTNVSISSTNVISATDTTYSSKTEVSGGTDVSLVTTGEKYTWNHKVYYKDYYKALGHSVGPGTYGDPLFDQYNITVSGYTAVGVTMINMDGSYWTVLGVNASLVSSGTKLSVMLTNGSSYTTGSNIAGTARVFYIKS